MKELRDFQDWCKNNEVKDINRINYWISEYIYQKSFNSKALDKIPNVIENEAKGKICPLCNGSGKRIHTIDVDYLYEDDKCDC